MTNVPKWLLICATALSSSCGSAQETQDAQPDSAIVSAEINLDDFPDDFPEHLMPPRYESATYLKLGAMDGASFESMDDVANAIAHYKALLGQPFSETGEVGSEQMVQWHLDAWVVSVIGICTIRCEQCGYAGGCGTSTRSGLGATSAFFELLTIPLNR